MTKPSVTKPSVTQSSVTQSSVTQPSITESLEAAQQIALNFQLDQGPEDGPRELRPSSETLAQALSTDTGLQTSTGEPKNICREAPTPYIQANLNLPNLGRHSGDSNGGVVERTANPGISPASRDEQAAIDAEVLTHGAIFLSPGGHFTYRVIGPCCRLFDRNELPWPCCRIQWRSKEPSWRRIGKRFVPDLATKSSPSYAVEILDHDSSPEPVVVTVYWMPLSSSIRAWWYRKYVPSQTD
ncbi:MAG: hypothetical protein AB4042_01380 [Leptolyngbyaceae cyanobacterium]